MSELVDIHPTVRLDPTVERKNESHHHWAIKAAITDRLRSDPAIVGTIETERKTGELIADIRCHLSDSPANVPRNVVVEIETAASNKDRLQATERHLRFGYGVFWVFTTDALKARRSTETRLAERMSSRPSLGVASLPDGELSLGAPITWHGFTYETPWFGRSELRIPTYDRYADWYNFGDFHAHNQCISIYHQPGSHEFFVSQYLENGQQTLPRRTSLGIHELGKRIQGGDIKRHTPIRGPP